MVVAHGHVAASFNDRQHALDVLWFASEAKHLQAQCLKHRVGHALGIVGRFRVLRHDLAHLIDVACHGGLAKARVEFFFRGRGIEHVSMIPPIGLVREPGSLSWACMMLAKPKGSS